MALVGVVCFLLGVFVATGLNILFDELFEETNDA